MKQVHIQPDAYERGIIRNDHAAAVPLKPRTYLAVLVVLGRSGRPAATPEEKASRLPCITRLLPPALTHSPWGIGNGLSAR